MTLRSIGAGGGSQGPQGVQGPQGPTGGVQGAQGPQGVQGTPGIQGAQGFQGDAGSQGAQGFQGVTGAQGVQGSTGSQGPQGFQGATGPQGTQGFQGPQGATGSQGPQGFQGTQGFQGAQGNQGLTGGTGAQGTGTTSTGAYGSEPGSPNTGDLYFPDNSFFIERYSGSVWDPWGPSYRWTTPVDGDFSWVNQGGASVDTTDGGILLVGPSGALGINMRIRIKTAPGTPYTLTVAMLPLYGFSGSPIVGICWRESGSQKIVRYGYYQTSGNIGRLQLATLNSATSFNSASAPYFDQTLALYGTQPLWLRFTDDGANRICYISNDGRYWLLMSSISRTDWITADQIGFFVESNDTVFDVATRLIHWKET